MKYEIFSKIKNLITFSVSYSIYQKLYKIIFHFHFCQDFILNICRKEIHFNQIADSVLLFKSWSIQRLDKISIFTVLLYVMRSRSGLSGRSYKAQLYGFRIFQRVPSSGIPYRAIRNKVSNQFVLFSSKKFFYISNCIAWLLTYYNLWQNSINAPLIFTNRMPISEFLYKLGHSPFSNIFN